MSREDLIRGKWMQSQRDSNFEKAFMLMQESCIGSLTHDFIQKIHAQIMGATEKIGYRLGFGAPPIVNEKTGHKVYLPPDSGTKESMHHNF